VIAEETTDTSQLKKKPIQFEQLLHAVEDTTVPRPAKPAVPQIHSSSKLRTMNLAPGEPGRPNLGCAAEVPEESNDIFKHFDWISRFSPSFGVCGNKIKVLNRPEDFYSSLKASILYNETQVQNMLYILARCLLYTHFTVTLVLSCNLSCLFMWICQDILNDGFV